MNDLISPKYVMKLVQEVHDAIWAEYNSYKDVTYYVTKWQEDYGGYESNFRIQYKEGGNIDLSDTLHGMPGELILRIAVDLGVNTPDFIPSIPEFKNRLKSSYETSYHTFVKAFKNVSEDPSLAVGLANSALESIIKEILKDDRMSAKIKGNETLFKLTEIILKEFQLHGDNIPSDIVSIGRGVININQKIESLRSTKTHFHGKTSQDYVISDSLYAMFVINTATTIGLFFDGVYKEKYPTNVEVEEEDDDLPF
ncbi:abortive infection Abi-like protein [Neolewinella xylanilytica]|uniref:Abortive infection Abi-like protein n=1 Tax=Neolewinella xylanilytica TaxID=1514080 RepID=A0A2S6HZM1_9BACT|nr:abortive infection family protein [Neolewinella xylanilytica]PPK83792.1 abortive infection Abi-like protein [Neolewinella xylanilytica]